MDGSMTASYKSCLTDPDLEEEAPVPSHKKTKHPYYKGKKGKSPPHGAEHKKDDDFIQEDEDELPAFIKARNEMKK